MLGFSRDEINNLKAEFTINEIAQQPKMWREVLKLYNGLADQIKTFQTQLQNKPYKYILVGAGTSEFVGNVLFEYLKTQGLDAVSIATTDIVSNPGLYFKNDQPTVLISFARSGNSPESQATVEYAKQLISDLVQIIIICNKEGQLAVKNHDDHKSLVLLLPEATNDKSFAMTSSFTSMLLYCLVALTKDDNSDHLAQEINNIINIVDNVINNDYQIIKKIAQEDHQRIIFLGSNILKGYAQEAHLKVLELSAGEVTTFFNSSLGFRHGPKSVVNNESLIVFFLSQNPYTRQYDLDLLKEIAHDQVAKTIVVIDHLNDNNVTKYCHYYLTNDSSSETKDIVAGLSYIVRAQIYAVYKAIWLNKSPDNPCPTGEVNRVVKGVTIYPYQNK
ncbi:SIS domain-containing protein [Spiroplasma sp. DGKH1]|uniref:SIS domain-containing protein n=1 Tax=Spiroplasma sp. DGKH1 TaxID=3050074 RepID=UPI0034C6D009